VSPDPVGRPVPAFEALEPVGPNFVVGRREAQNKRSRLQRRPGPHTRERTIHAIQSWTEQLGASPTTTDRESSSARRLGQEWRAEHFEIGEWPSARVVNARLGSFNAAIAAGGCTPRRAALKVSADLLGPAAILDAFVRLTKCYGDLPTMAGWDPARARRLGQDSRTARYLHGDWSSARSVARRFGSFANVAAMAALIPRAAVTQYDDRPYERLRDRRVVARLSASGHDPGVEDLTRTLKTLAAAQRASDPVAVHRGAHRRRRRRAQLGRRGAHVSCPACPGPPTNRTR
jgi:hypothetical protein